MLKMENRNTINVSLCVLSPRLLLQKTKTYLLFVPQNWLSIIVIANDLPWKSIVFVFRLLYTFLIIWIILTTHYCMGKFFIKHLNYSSTAGPKYTFGIRQHSVCRYISRLSKWNRYSTDFLIYYFISTIFATSFTFFLSNFNEQTISLEMVAWISCHLIG